MIRVRTIRGPNMVDAQPERLVSDDGLRLAYGRNVKGEAPRGQPKPIVRIWTLKARVPPQGLPVMLRGATEAQARAWVAGKSLAEVEAMR